MPPVNLKQVLAPLNTIVQKLAAIDERQAGHRSLINNLKNPPTLTSWQHNIQSLLRR
jgi:hypothetical protein